MAAKRTHSHDSSLCVAVDCRVTAAGCTGTVRPGADFSDSESGTGNDRFYRSTTEAFWGGRKTCEPQNKLDLCVKHGAGAGGRGGEVGAGDKWGDLGSSIGVRCAGRMSLVKHGWQGSTLAERL